MSWVCKIMARSHRPDGRKVEMCRFVECGGNVEAGMIRALAARKDQGHPFLGCVILAITPIGQMVIRILDPDTGQLVKED